MRASGEAWRSGDILAAYLSLLFVTFVVHAGNVSLRWWIVCLAPFVIFSAKTIGLYERDQYTLRKTTLDEAPTMVHLAVFYALVVWLAQGALFHGQLARAQVFALAVSEFLVMFVARSVIRAAVLAMSPAERCVVLGSAGDTERTAAKLCQSSGVKAEVVGRVALRARRPAAGKHDDAAPRGHGQPRADHRGPECRARDHRPRRP